MYLDEYNNIIRETQNKILKSIILRRTLIVDTTTADLETLKKSINNYQGDLDSFFDRIKGSVLTDQ